MSHDAPSTRPAPEARAIPNPVQLQQTQRPDTKRTGRPSDRSDGAGPEAPEARTGVLAELEAGHRCD